MELPLRSWVPLFSVLPASGTGVDADDEFDPAEVEDFELLPHPAASSRTAPARIRILRMPKRTDRTAERIATRPNLSGAARRTDQVWDASDEALVAGLALHDHDAALVFVRRFQRR